MAVDKTDIARNLCNRLIKASEYIMTGIEEIGDIKDLKESAGISFTATDVEAVLSGTNSPFKHATGADFDSVITSGTAIQAWMISQFHDDNLQRVRTGRPL